MKALSVGNGLREHSELLTGILSNFWPPVIYSISNKNAFQLDAYGSLSHRSPRQRSPLDDRDSTGKRPLRTETPRHIHTWTETPPPPPRQRLSGTEPPRQTPLPAGQRPPVNRQTPVKTLPCLILRMRL